MKTAYLSAAFTGLTAGAPVLQPDWAKGTALGKPSTFDNFGCTVPQAAPDTPDPVLPDVVVEREVYDNLDLVMPDGAKLRVWGFRDPRSSAPATFPSPAIRVREGQVVHTRLHVKKGAHTIHHHGIEPLAFNDGVGHSSFEVNPTYTYQWRPHQAGTYAYHCHVNTVLHFEMGMYGLLIVDPPEGPGRVFSGGPKYDVEAFWVLDDFDPRWHTLDHGAGLCGGDAGLDRFEPKYFVVTGVTSDKTRTDPRVAVRARQGQSILVRAVNSCYGPTRMTIAGLDAQIVAADARPLTGRYARPIDLPAGRTLDLITAQRYDLIIPAVRTGVFPVQFEYLDWLTGRVVGRTDTTITITA